MKLTAEQQTLAEENLGLVHACANRFRGRGAEYEDLVQAGSVGLVKAAGGYDPALGYRFSTYAVPAILGEMKRLFRDGGSVKLGRAAKQRSCELLRLQETLTAKLGREPGIGELAEAAGMDVCEAAALLNAGLPAVSLTLDENADEDVPVPSHEEHTARRMDLKRALDRLDDTERVFLSLRYEQCLTQTRVAELLGMTQVQVSRREKKILLKMRGWMD